MAATPRGSVVRSGMMGRMDIAERIVVTPGVRSGKPCIRGTRVTVYDVLEYLAGGMTELELLADFPSLTAQDVRACLAFAAARERRRAPCPSGIVGSTATRRP